MNVKLLHSMVGDRFAYQPRHIVRCSEKTGKSYLDAGFAVAASDDAEVDGEIFDEAAETKVPPPRKQAPEKTERPKPETPEAQSERAHCAGQTTRGNACMRAVVKGSKFCDNHQDQK